MREFTVIKKFEVNGFEFILLDYKGQNWVSLSKIDALIRYKYFEGEYLPGVLNERYEIFKTVPGSPLKGRKFLSVNDLSNWISELHDSNIENPAKKLLAKCVKYGIEYEESILMDTPKDKTIVDDSYHKDHMVEAFTIEELQRVVNDSVSMQLKNIIISLDTITKAQKNHDNLFGILKRIENELEKLNTKIAWTNSSVTKLEHEVDDLYAKVGDLYAKVDTSFKKVIQIVKSNEKVNSEEYILDIDDVKEVFDKFGIEV